VSELSAPCRARTPRAFILLLFIAAHARDAVRYAEVLKVPAAAQCGDGDKDARR